MSFEITGKIVAKYDVVQRTQNFRTREFVIEKVEDYGGKFISQFIKFQLVQDRTSLIDRFQEGDEVKVSFNLKGSKWEKDGRVNYITNLDAWRIELVEPVQHVSPSTVMSDTGSGYESALETHINNDAEGAEGDDLPF
ncbi:MAG: DUF3127 domain-containing protein [Thermoflavifilum sp.]|jgi:hypothetical protein|uniref:DUF3127 domain-containing protein n=1 Tax=Thermoflavifilum sp. TaxID=1968839 RepID=UPI0018A523D9|nr:DUF3127 domain-containing protein [Thermoflavifilum sp.]QOR74948.1 MAG: DUF3127 domain-containing protein [Thermoflavifilum sp.]